MARILCVCPACWDVYWQENVPADFVGRCRKPMNHMVGLKALCDMADKVGGKHGVYYPMLCADCCTRERPPALREAARVCLSRGETKTGAKQEIRD